MSFELTLTVLGISAVLLLIAFIPATYFNQALEGTMVGRRRREARQLGLPEIFEPAPRLLPHPRAYVIPLVLVTLAVSMGILLAALLWISATALGQSDAPLWVNVVAQGEGWLRSIFFGFVGAFLFSVQVVARRYREGDLDPQVYFAVAERIIVALLIAGMLGLTYPAFAAPDLVDTVEIAVYIIAFTVGIFPESGLQWLTSLGRQWLRPQGALNKQSGRDYDLTRLPGVNIWQAFRLNMAGIEHIPDLANADIQQLLRQTHYGIQQVYDWIDQAILYIHVTDEMWDKCRALSVRSLTDFQGVYADPQTRKALAQGLSVDEGQLLILKQTMLQTPNGDQVQVFWRYNTARATGAIRFYNLGQAYFELGEYDKAIDNLNQAMTYASSDAQLYATRGDVWSLKGDFQQAIEDYDQSLRFDPQAPGVLHQRGLAHLNQGHYALAVEDFSRALVLDERNPELFNDRGRAFQKQGKLDKALLDFDRAIELDASYALAFDNRGELHRVEHRTQEALADLTRALELDPNLVSTYYHIGLLRREMELWPEALNAFTRAVSLEPNLAEAYNARGQVYQSQGDFAKAIEDFGRAIGCNPNYAEAFNNRGIARRLSGDLLLAYQDHSRAIELDERYTLAYINRGITLLAADEARDALRDFDKAIDLDDRSAIAYNHRGLARHALNETRLALEDFDRAIQLNPEYVEAYNNRGNARAALKQYAEAIGDFTQALKLAESADIYLNRGNVYLDQSEFQAAADDYERAISLHYEFPLAHLNRGQAFVELGRLGDALDSFRKASELDPQNALAFYRVAQVSARLGQQDEALDALEHAVALDEDYRTAAQTDKDLQALKDTPRFKAIIAPQMAQTDS